MYVLFLELLRLFENVSAFSMQRAKVTSTPSPSSLSATCAFSSSSNSSSSSGHLLSFSSTFDSSEFEDVDSASFLLSVVKMPQFDNPYQASLGIKYLWDRCVAFSRQHLANLNIDA